MWSATPGRVIAVTNRPPIADELMADLGPKQAPIVLFSYNVIYGSNLADGIDGTFGSDMILAAGGDDRMTGNAGIDTFSVGSSADGDILLGFDGGGSVELNGVANPGINNLADLADFITVDFG